MTTDAFDAVTRRTASGLSRRRSLLTLGSAALAAPLVKPRPGAAKKKSNKCRKKEKQRCSNDAAACKATVRPLCDPLNPEDCIALQNCCDACSASGFLNCLIASSQI